MLVLLHVLVAISSIIYSSVLLFRPRQGSFGLAYGLVGATLASGTILVISLQTHILQTCVSGLVYLAFVASMLALAKYRLAKQTVKISKDAQSERNRSM